MTAEQEPEGEARSRPAARFTRATLVGCGIAVGALTAWFLFAWLVLDRMMLDAAGEAIGSGLLLLVVISIIGALLRGTRDPD
ncbi:hypothetical protein [Hamadaea tsunoensis]|uniref:hypothetical protein n=1 Tax=Hamadaea tsunoensis TaxID=53368 RepID=UPI000416ABA8|nr:hypothetical protein [Hamadaea tsunoensis]